MVGELVIRFLIGGAVVCAFATLGDLFRPKSFAGLFGAAPSVALATLFLTVTSKGRYYAALEARSMIVGAAAFFLYASWVSWVMMRLKRSALLVTTACIPLWLLVCWGMWVGLLR